MEAPGAGLITRVNLEEEEATQRFIPEEITPVKKTRKVPVLSKEEFNEYIDTLVEQERDLREAAAEVYALPKSKSFPIPPSAEFPRFDKPFNFGRVELKSLYTEHQRSLKYIKRLYAAALEYREKRAVKKKPAVFTKPVISFFANVDLGPIWFFRRGEGEEEGGEWLASGRALQEGLPLFFRRGIAYTETVINLFYIYSYRNGLQNGTGYRADATMLEYFGPIFNAIIDYDTAHPKKPSKTPEPNKRKGPAKDMGGVFDPQSFALTGFNRIARWTRRFKPTEKDIPEGAPILTEEELEELLSPELAAEMDIEFTISENAKYINKLQRDKGKEAA